uniref:Protein FAM76A n=1 Tax=Anthurium amnicola TaxID=1678845 RepID=A0A1D1Z0Q3_9ARAE
MSSEREELEGNGVEEEGDEPSGGSPISSTPLSPPGPQKGPPSSTSSRSSPPLDPYRRKTRDLPNIYNCHSCGLRFPDNGGRERLQPLDSQWRIVLLCRACLHAIRSAVVCAYCFVSFAEENEGSIACRRCSGRVHLKCVPQQRGYLAPSDLDPDSFVCVDCCALPKSPVRKPGDFRGSGNIRVSGVSLEGVVRDANLAAARKLALATKAKEKALAKAAAAKRAAELARCALNLVVLAEEEPMASSQAAGPDEELVSQLHRAVNGSQRISRSVFPENSDCFATKKRGRCSANSLSNDSESGGYCIFGKVELCTEDTLFETSGSMDATRLNVIGSSQGKYHLSIELREGTNRNKEISKSGRVDEEKVPARGEQGSFSDMIVCSTRNDSSVDAVSATCPGSSVPDAFHSSFQQDEKHNIPDRYMKKYCKRSSRMKDRKANGKHNIPDRYMKKYCKRSSRMKDRKANGGSASLLVPVSQ